MKTITQLKDEVKNLMKASADIDAMCTNENRGLKPEEMVLKDEILDSVESLNSEIKVREREERMAALLETAPAPASEPKPSASGVTVGIDRKSKDTFKSFDEQLIAVKTAFSPTGSIDPRLYNAATGLNESVGNEGAFLVQQDYSNELLKEVYETGQLASRCRKQPISGNANSIKINGVDETSRAASRMGGVKGYWADEADEKTASKPKFRKIELTLKKLVGLCYLTDELMEDAAGIGAFVHDAFVSEFGFLLDDAIYNGLGAAQPLGILNAGSLVTVPKEGGQGADTILTQNLVNMYARRFAGMTGNYVWLYNQNIEPQLMTMSLAVGAGGSATYLPPGGLSGAPYGNILGLPAIAIEHAATLGDVGDIVLANLPNGYILAEKGGIKSDLSIHVRFIYDEQVFRFILRVDGQPVRATALTPAKGTDQLSHFIALAARA